MLFTDRTLASIGAAIPALVLAASVSAITPPAAKFTYWELKNGLRVIIAEDHTAPVFSIAVVYNVGSRDERERRTGFAHLFEHMMFKASQNVGAGVSGGTISRTGARATPSTSSPSIMPPTSTR